MMTDILNQIDGLVWGPWLLVLLVGTGVLLTCRLSLLQVLKLPRALKLIFFARNKGDGDIDSFKALCTALAATVGTGNIVGVATAIKLGGPGALFWMWLAASSAWRPSMRKAALRSSTEGWMTRAILPAARCTISKWVLARNGSLSLSLSPSSAS